MISHSILLRPTLVNYHLNSLWKWQLNYTQFHFSFLFKLIISGVTKYFFIKKLKVIGVVVE